MFIYRPVSVDSFKKGSMRFYFTALCREREEVSGAGKQGAQEFVFPEG